MSRIIRRLALARLEAARNNLIAMNAIAEGAIMLANSGELELFEAEAIIEALRSAREQYDNALRDARKTP